MWKKWFATGAGFAALAVILGAFAAHGLKKHLETGDLDLQQLQNFETGARYQFYHALALIACAFLAKLSGENKLLRIAAILFIAGIICFSGSLYLLSTRTIIGLDHWKWLGPVTPLGGLCFITGWILLAVAALKQKN